MDILTFLTEIVDSVAWPVAAVAIGILLKAEISSLIKRVTRFKHGESEIEFGELLAEAQSSVEQEFLEVGTPSTPNLERLKKLAEQSPRGAILDAWLQVEDELHKYARAMPISTEYVKNATDLIRAIEFHSMEMPGIGKGVLRMAWKLHTLRNEAVHLNDKEITYELAVDYIELAERVKNRLEEA